MVKDEGASVASRRDDLTERCDEARLPLCAADGWCAGFGSRIPTKVGRKVGRSISFAPALLLAALLLPLSLSLASCATARTYNDPTALRTVSGKLRAGPNLGSDHEICDFMNARYDGQLDRCHVSISKLETRAGEAVDIVNLSISADDHLGKLMQVWDMSWLPEHTVGGGNFHIVDVHCGKFAVWDLKIEDHTYVVLRSQYNDKGQLDNSYLGDCPDEQ